MTAFKKELKRLLVCRQLTAAELARRTGIPKQSISDWLGGTRPSNMDYVKALARELDTTVIELLYGPSTGVEAESGTGSSILGVILGLNLGGTSALFELIFQHCSDLIQVRSYPKAAPASFSRSWKDSLGWEDRELKKNFGWSGSIRTTAVERWRRSSDAWRERTIARHFAIATSIRMGTQSGSGPSSKPTAGS